MDARAAVSIREVEGDDRERTGVLRQKCLAHRHEETLMDRTTCINKERQLKGNVLTRTKVKNKEYLKNL